MLAIIRVRSVSSVADQKLQDVDSSAGIVELFLCVWRTQLVQILSDGGHDVHLLISESYDRFEHHVDATRSRHITARHRRSPVDHLPCDHTAGVASSCSSCNDTSSPSQ